MTNSITGTGPGPVFYNHQDDHTINNITSTISETLEANHDSVFQFEFKDQLYSMKYNPTGNGTEPTYDVYDVQGVFVASAAKPVNGENLVIPQFSGGDSLTIVDTPDKDGVVTFELTAPPTRHATIKGVPVDEDILNAQDAIFQHEGTGVDRSPFNDDNQIGWIELNNTSGLGEEQSKFLTKLGDANGFLSEQELVDLQKQDIITIDNDGNISLTKNGVGLFEISQAMQGDPQSILGKLQEEGFIDSTGRLTPAGLALNYIVRSDADILNRIGDDDPTQFFTNTLEMIQNDSYSPIDRALSQGLIKGDPQVGYEATDLGIIVGGEGSYAAAVKGSLLENNPPDWSITHAGADYVTNNKAIPIGENVTDDDIISNPVNPTKGKGSATIKGDSNSSSQFDDVYDLSIIPADSFKITEDDRILLDGGFEIGTTDGSFEPGKYSNDFQGNISNEGGYILDPVTGAIDIASLPGGVYYIDSDGELYKDVDGAPDIKIGEAPYIQKGPHTVNSAVVLDSLRILQFITEKDSVLTFEVTDDAIISEPPPPSVAFFEQTLITSPDGGYASVGEEAYFEGNGTPVDVPNGVKEGTYYITEDGTVFKVNDMDQWQEFNPWKNGYKEDGMTIERNGKAIPPSVAFFEQTLITSPDGGYASVGKEAYFDGNDTPVDVPNGVKEGTYYITEDGTVFKVNDMNQLQEFNPWKNDYKENGMSIELIESPIPPSVAPSKQTLEIGTPTFDEKVENELARIRSTIFVGEKADGIQTEINGYIQKGIIHPTTGAFDIETYMDLYPKTTPDNVRVKAKAWETLFTDRKETAEAKAEFLAEYNKLTNTEKGQFKLTKGGNDVFLYDPHNKEEEDSIFFGDIPSDEREIVNDHAFQDFYSGKTENEKNGIRQALIEIFTIKDPEISDPEISDPDISAVETDDE